ncbi:MAG: DUF748 domain-containing protein [Bacteroidales bacterium]|nr:DUF748 domain-containing protein [Bacteroidales bacterium]
MTSETKNNHHRRFYQNKRFLIPFFIVLALVAFRIYLPTLVKNYVNKTLADIPGYYGHVADIDIALYRGAYVIDSLYLNKVSAETQIPFLNFPKTDISVEWRALFRGKIVSEIYMTNPQITYIPEDQKPGADTAEVAKATGSDWTEALRDLVPIDINHLEINGGKLSFMKVQADPNIDVFINNLSLTADNLRNVKAKERTLPSPITMRGTAIGDGKVSLDGRVNLIKEIPDVDLSFALEEVDTPALNDLSKHYADVDFASGQLNIYSEVAIADGHMTGYLKTMLTDTKLLGNDENFLETLWEGFVGFFNFVLKNQRTDTLATKVPLEGDLNNVEAGVWPAIKNIFVNAWIEAFTRSIDNEVKYDDAFKE